MAQRDTVVYVRVEPETWGSEEKIPKELRGKPRDFEFQYNGQVHTWKGGATLAVPYWLAEHARTVHAIGDRPRVTLLGEIEGGAAASKFAEEERKAKVADLKEKAKALLEEAKAEEERGKK